MALTGLAIAAAVAATFAWKALEPPGLPEGIASGNGRLEATEVDITAKFDFL